MALDVVLINPRLNGGKLRYKHLIGRQFQMGKHDCYDMLRQMFIDNLNIELTNYARPTDWWLEDGVDLYVDNYKSEGFFYIDNVQLADLRPFDVMLIAVPDSRDVKKTKTCHCAVYLGEGKIIHHRMGKMSEVMEYRGWVRHLTTHVIRHKDVPDLRSKYEQKLDVMSLMLPHKRELMMGALNEAKPKDK